MSQIAQSVEATGFCFLPSFRCELDDRLALMELGKPAKLEGVSEVQHLVPRSADTSPPNIYSGNFGYGEFPFHTDLSHWYTPPRYLALRCVVGSEAVLTKLLDSEFVVKNFGKNILERALIKPRRAYKNQRPTMRILDYRPNLHELIFRWDSLFTEPASQSGSEVFKEMAAFLSSQRGENIRLVHAGDTLVVDNWRLMHGRSSVPTTCLNRLIKRMYLEALH